jgi:hypothetical protein
MIDINLLLAVEHPDEYLDKIGYRLQTLFWDGSFTLEQP